MDLQVIKEQNPLPLVAEGRGIELRQSGSGFVGLCPFHDDHNPSLQIFLGDDGWGFKCYAASCGLAGDVLAFVGHLEFGQAWTGRGEQFKQALTQLENTRASPTPRVCVAKKAQERPQITADIQHTWDWALAVCAEHLLNTPEVLTYLRERNFDELTLRRWRFGFWPRPKPDQGSPMLAPLYAAGFTQEDLLEARLLREGQYGLYEFFGGARGQSGRIVSADVDHARRARYLLGRELPWESNPRGAKYLGLADFAKPIMGVAHLSWRKSPILLVEGFWNMLTLNRWGYDAVAVSGAQLSPQQVKALTRLRRPLVPVRDMDASNPEGGNPGEIALASWRAALPGMPEGIELPRQVDDHQVKDVNDLGRHPDGEQIFEKLAREWDVEAKK
ncbi:MAG: hypothetical protein DWQ07_17465 [Chloroflexi bacterium]|nr:MAG: hypothetical protein DWQ07_17465 [Chloroflexota bacterium]